MGGGSVAFNLPDFMNEGQWVTSLDLAPAAPLPELADSSEWFSGDWF